MKNKLISIIIISLVFIPGPLAIQALVEMTGNYQLEKVTKTQELNQSKCPKALNIELGTTHSSLTLKNRANGKLIEAFSNINQSKSLKKVEMMLWQETRTTMKRGVLTKRSRLCRGAIARNCRGAKYRPKMSLLNIKNDLIFNIYGSDHQLQTKCYYQRPNEVGL